MALKNQLLIDRSRRMIEEKNGKGNQPYNGKIVLGRSPDRKIQPIEGK